MSNSKKWQCPHCPQDSSRHWNTKVHIGRKHSFGDPVEKSDSDQAERSFFIHADRNKKKGYSQYHNKYRHTEGYKRGRRNDDFGDIIDYVYHILTEIEEKRYKMGEIHKIADRHNSSMTPKWVPSTNYDSHAFVNAFQAWLSELLKNYPSSKQRDSDSTVAASSQQEIKKPSHDLFSSFEKDNTRQSSSSIHPVSSGDEGSIDKDGWIVEDGWKVKRDMYGNVMSAYRLRDVFF
jgi:hypothetical protein